MKYLAILILGLMTWSCSSSSPGEPFYFKYEDNPDYTTKQVGDYVVVLGFKPKDSLNIVRTQGNKSTWQINHNQIVIENDNLFINKTDYGDIKGARLIFFDREKVFVDKDYRFPVNQKNDLNYWSTITLTPEKRTIKLLNISHKNIINKKKPFRLTEWTTPL